MSAIGLLAADGDGALYDTMGLACEALFESTQQLQADTTREDIARLFSLGIGLHEVFQQAAPNQAPQVTEALFYENEAALGYDDIELFPGMEEVLEELYVDHGIAIGIVTNRARASALQIVRCVGLLDVARFGITEERIVTPGGNIRPKPSADGVEYLMNLCGVTQEETAMYGDTPGDILTGVAGNTALKIGFMGGFGTAESMYEAGATKVIDKALDLRELLLAK